MLYRYLTEVKYLLNYCLRSNINIFDRVLPANMIFTSNFTFCGNVSTTWRDGAHLFCRNTPCLLMILYIDASKQLSASVHLLFVCYFLSHLYESIPPLHYIFNQCCFVVIFSSSCNRDIIKIGYILRANNSKRLLIKTQIYFGL